MSEHRTTARSHGRSQHLADSVPVAPLSHVAATHLGPSQGAETGPSAGGWPGRRHGVEERVDTDFSAGFDIVKIVPELVVRASLDGVETGTAEVLVDAEARAAKAALTGEPNQYGMAMALGNDSAAGG